MMEIFHKTLRELLLINDYLEDRRFGFLSIECPLPQVLKKITQAIPSYSIALQLRREYRHLAMGIRALSLKDIDSIFVMEAYNQHLLFLLPMLAATGKKILIGIHGNQQFAQESPLKALGLRYLQIYLQIFRNFKVVLFELNDDCVEDTYKFPEHSKLLIPLPMIGDIQPRLKLGERLGDQEKIKIGVVGIIRPDKPLEKILQKLQSFQSVHQDSCELIIGTPFRHKPTYLDKLEVSLRDTTLDEDYLKLLQELDILVIDLDRERYYYRVSGVISDAVSAGCYVIAPDYPLIKNQITWPEIVGVSFSCVEELESCLERAIYHVKKSGQDNHWQWREKRSAKYIAQLLVTS